MFLASWWSWLVQPSDGCGSDGCHIRPINFGEKLAIQIHFVIFISLISFIQFGNNSFRKRKKTHLHNHLISLFLIVFLYQIA